MIINNCEVTIKPISGESYWGNPREARPYHVNVVHLKSKAFSLGGEADWQSALRLAAALVAWFNDEGPCPFKEGEPEDDYYY